MNNLDKYKYYLINDERSDNTIYCYISDVKKFEDFLCGRPLSKDLAVEYKACLKGKYKLTTANRKICALNAYFKCIGFNDISLKTYKIQKSNFRDDNKNISFEEYQRLVNYAKEKNKIRVLLIIETLASTGIRISELEFVTVESLSENHTFVNNKGKLREIIIPNGLRLVLKKYCEKSNIHIGPVFSSRNGNPLNRSNIYKEMKLLAKGAGVKEDKVYPHNFRHFFAYLYYDQTKNIVRLSDLLGHSSISTTQIYARTNIDACIEEIDSLCTVIVS